MDIREAGMSLQIGKTSEFIRLFNTAIVQISTNVASSALFIIASCAPANYFASGDVKIVLLPA
jgi:hypothetical protein